MNLSRPRDTVRCPKLCNRTPGSVICHASQNRRAGRRTKQRLPPKTASIRMAPGGPRSLGTERMSELITPDELPRWIPGRAYWGQGSARLGRRADQGGHRYTAFGCSTTGAAGLPDRRLSGRCDPHEPALLQVTGALERVGPGSISPPNHVCTIPLAVEPRHRGHAPLSVRRELWPTSPHRPMSGSVRDVELLDVLNDRRPPPLRDRPPVRARVARERTRRPTLTSTP